MTVQATLRVAENVQDETLCAAILNQLELPVLLVEADTSVSYANAAAKAIIEQLQEDGRRPYTKIAGAVGLSEAAVRQRVQQMIDAGVMQIVAVTDPLTLGFRRMAMVGVKVDGDMRAVADTLAAVPEIDYVVITAGSFEGERLRGRVLTGGGDWTVRRADGVVDLDLRITLEAPDGAPAGPRPGADHRGRAASAQRRRRHRPLPAAPRRHRHPHLHHRHHPRHEELAAARESGKRVLRRAAALEDPGASR